MSRNPWIRLYREALHDPKLVTLPDRQFRAWVNCLLIADDTGLLPSRRDIAVHMRVSIVDVDNLLTDLVEAELIDADATSGPVIVYRMHGWKQRQYASDTSAERMRKHRAKKRDVTRDERPSPSDVTCDAIEPDSEPDSDTDTENKNTTPEVPAEVKVGFRFAQGGSGSRDVSSRLKSIAEGFGLNVHKLIDMASASHVETPNAYFRELVIAELRRELPRAPKPLLASALTKDGDAARKSVYQMLNSVSTSGDR